jgi:hypothetical protein
MEGLEPPRLAALDPKSRASTNSATSAKNTLIKSYKSCIRLETYYLVFNNNQV